MTDHKPWCWEVAPSGPDWIFIAHVSPASAADLAQAAAAVVPQGYTFCPRDAAPCRYHQQVCSYVTFVDTSNLEAYRMNLRGDATQKNIWIYNIIEVHRDVIEIECGYGGRGEEYNRAETAWLLAVLTTPGIVLRDWKVVAGGEGYDYKTIREGSGIDDLRRYIT